MTDDKQLSRDLSENSAVYATEPELYETFAMAEDRPGCVSRFLGEHARDKDVLEIGCGTGKYVRLLSPCAGSYATLEISLPMLEFARKASVGRPVSFHHGSADSLPFPDSAFGLVFATWVFGTIMDQERRMKAIEEAKRVTRPGGKIFLVENDAGGKFEEIRGRWPDTSRTNAYNSWLQYQAGFREHARFESFFEFPTLAQAKNVFGRIWNLEAEQKVLSRTVEHKIIVFSFTASGADPKAL